MSDTETFTARCPQCHEDADWTATRRTVDRGDAASITTEHVCPTPTPV